jgi:hypothetical protein
LREILVGRPDAHLLHALVERCEMRGRRQRIVRLQLHHGPHCDAHGLQIFLERVKLRQQRFIDAIAGLVAGPQIVTKRLDHVIRGDAEMGGPALDHLEHGMQHTRHGPERFVVALVETSLPVEMPEQLIGPVDQMNDHSIQPPLCRIAPQGSCARGVPVALPWLDSACTGANRPSAPGSG